MKTISEELFHHAQKRWEKLNLFESPYFLNLINGEMGKEKFIETQKAFYYAVSYFSKPMLILASRIDTAEARLQIIENIYEEHGEMKREDFHENSFKKWLNRLCNGCKASIKEEPIHPSVDAFNSSLIGVCHLAAVEKGVCCLGMIEYMFSHISKCIAETVVKLGWLDTDNLIHYNLHADLDIKHSKDLLEVVDKLPSYKKENCLEGIELGVFIFTGLYNDLFESFPSHEFTAT